MLAQIAFCFGLGWMVQRLVGHQDVFDGCLIALCLGAVAAWLAFSLAAQWFAQRAGTAASSTVSLLVFDKVVALGASRVRVVDDARISALMGDGAEKLRPYFSNYLPQFFYAVLAPLTLFAFMVPVCLPAAIALLVCVPLMPASIMMLMTRAKRFMGDYWGTFVDLGAAFLNSVKGLVTLKIYRSDKQEQEALDAQAEEFRQITMKLLKVQLNSVTFMDLFTYGGMAVGFLVALWQALAGGLDAFGVVVTLLLASSFFLPMRSFGSQFHTGMNAGPVIDDLVALLEAPDPRRGTVSLEAEQVTIQASGVGFSYALDGTDSQLRDVALDVRPNSFIGLTGPSGSGKSTLVGILSGMLEGYMGSILVNGVELRDISPDSLRNLVTVVSRSSHLFYGTFRTNLLMAVPSATDAQLWEALRQAKLDDFALSMGGLDAQVLEGGSNLSGGQRQRLVFARALLRNTPIYLFDEATSNMDAQSEQFLMAAIQKIALRKTVIVATHRLHQLAYADEILVLDEGRVAERGTHAQLMSAKGIYRSLWDKTETLERFAQQVMEELPPDQPSALEQALAQMPGMMGGIMRAFTSIIKTERYAGMESQVPQGHPAWIPLPHYQPGMTKEQVLAATAEPEEASSPLGENADQPAPSGMAGFMDATMGDMDPEEVAKIKQAMATVKENLKAPQVHVKVLAPPPAHRDAFAIMSGLLKVTGVMVPELALACLLGFISWACALGVVVFAGCGLADAVGLGTLLPMPVCVALCLACALLRGPAHYGERILTHDQTFKTLSLIRSRVFSKLRTLTPAKLEARNSGDLISLLMSDVDLLEGFYSRTCAPAFSVVTFSLAVVVGLAFADGFLAGVAALVMVVVGAVLPIASSRLTRQRGAELRAYAVAMTTFLLDSLAGMADLLHLGRAQEYAQELAEHMDSLSGGEDGFGLRTAVLSALPQAFAFAGVFLFAGAAFSQVLSGHLSASACLVSLAAFAASLDGVTSLAGLGFSLHQTLAAADRVLDTLEEEPQVSDVLDGVDVEGFEGLGITGVAFAYEPEDAANGLYVLKDIDFAVEPGTFVGISGESGVGKSTLLKLLMRFWDVNQGSVAVNGHDVRRINTDSLRRLQSYMTQDTYIFQGSLRRNLLVARPDASDDDLLCALQKASLGDFLASLPEGLDAPLGQAGHGLSDGERQRIGLARAFLSDAPLMLLDEPTSNLDALNEALVLRALCENSQGKTVLIVSHRKAVAAIVDKLLVVEGSNAS